MGSRKDTDSGSSNGNGNLTEPLVDKRKESEVKSTPQKGSLFMVLFSTFIAVCGAFEFGSCVGYSSPAQFGIMEDLHQTYSEYSVFGSILTIGAVVGAITSGRFADWLGRKGAMRISSIVCIVGWIAIYLGFTSVHLDIGRFLTGCGIGVISYTVPVYIAEITPKNLRGALATANQLFITMGILFAYAVGAFVSWRTLALTGLIPSVIMIIGLSFIPESPRWLAMAGQKEKFEAALKTLRGPDVDISRERTEIQESLAVLRQLPEVKVLDMFNSRNFPFVFIGVGLMVFQQAIGINGIIYYAGQVFVSAGVSPSVGSILYSGLQVFTTAFVLLELLSGKKACEIKDGKTLLLTDWAWGLVKEGRTMDVIEDNIPELGLPQIMEQYVLTAVLCAHPILHARLTMEQLVKILESNFSVSSVLRAYVDSSSPSSNRELISVNFTEEMGSRKDTDSGSSNGNGNLTEPLVDKRKESEVKSTPQKGSLFMVLFSTFIAVCGAFEFGSCVGYSSPAQFGIMEDLHQTYSEYSVFGSILTIGAVVGAITSGRFADWLGRKGTSVHLDIGRFLTGCGIGVISYTVPVYIAEITPKNLRGALATANQLFITMGILFAYAVGAFVSWRTLALTGLIPSVIMIIGLSFIPESPRWLAMAGQKEKFEAALKTLRGPDVDISRERTEIQESLAVLRQLPEVKVLDMFNSRNFPFVFIGVGLMVFQQAIGINGIIYYAGQVFVSAGVSPSVGSILYSGLQVFATAFGATLMDRAGRRPLLMISVAGLLVGSLSIGTSFLLKEHGMAPEVSPVLALVGVMVYIAFFSVGTGPIPWVIMSEIFPLNLKGPAGSLVTLVNWLGSWAISYSFIFLFEWSSFGVFFLYAGFCVLSMVFTIKFVPETKGRTLEDIQASIR
ncbi:sugar transporter ERD6-like 8 [Pistacia vera]|uniref:sugar transporter ERD6-like 8 n=1 Tax=Pistacia vera TaxID=55513 RepID=UPI0012637327|nr:sugar transporter ERD6-like 8 [Pistacia vera]